MAFTRDEVAAACRQWGSLLALPAGIDGAQLLWAISGCESSFGANCKPRHEPYYHNLADAGTNAQLVALTRLYGCDAHSSFGPWQELLVNCTPEMKPENFADINRAAAQAVRFINRRILQAEQAKTIEQIAVAYNSGKWKWLTVPPGAERYAKDCQRYYDTTAMPLVSV
jgi:hypothetical protein